MKKKERRKRKSEEKERRRREKKQWLQWRIQGRDPPPPAPLIFRPNLGPKGPKKDCYSFYYFESDFSFRISI